MMNEEVEDSSAEVKNSPRNFLDKALARKNIIGLVLCIIVFLTGFVFNGNVAMFFNLAGILIVAGGMMGAMIISFPLERLVIVYKVLINTYRTRVKEPDEIIEILVDLSVKSRLKGILSLEEDEEEISIMFLRKALGFVVDNYHADQIRDLLNSEMYFFKLRRQEIERILRTMAEITPAFGIIGSVVGLIAMLAGVGDIAVILKTVPVALTSTLYGVLLSNFFFLPFAARIRERTDQELLVQKIILEGAVAIGSNLHPRTLEAKLKSFLTPSSRTGQLVSLKRIQEKFNIKPDADSAEEGEEEEF